MNFEFFEICSIAGPIYQGEGRADLEKINFNRGDSVSRITVGDGIDYALFFVRGRRAAPPVNYRKPLVLVWRG